MKLLIYTQLKNVSLNSVFLSFQILKNMYHLIVFISYVIALIFNKKRLINFVCYINNPFESFNIFPLVGIK